jgi:RNA polymerase sigma factor (TIGR02999 family)
MRGESAGHTLQPTALVNEAYLRLVDQKRAGWQNRAHFLALASQMMRRILVDHARRRRMTKRSGRWVKLTFDEMARATSQPGIDVQDLDEALHGLAEFDPRKSQVAELRFFGGLTLEETGHVLGISIATAEREWRAARAWLSAQLARDRP